MSPLSNWERPRDGAIEARFRPFREQGLLDTLETEVARRLGALVGETDADVLLGLALAVRAPAHGHICVDLNAASTLDLRSEPGDDSVDPALLPSLPEDRVEWLARIGRSPLVRGPAPGDGDPVRPFVLERSRLYTDRYFTYQQRLAAALRGRFEARPKLTDPAFFRRGLDVLFPRTGDGAPAIDRQRLAAAMAVLRGFAVISGGPGTGKTYTVRSILTLLWAQWTAGEGSSGRPLLVSLVAPTGKAARRLLEAVLTGLDAFLELARGAVPPEKAEALRPFLLSLETSTLHRLLRWNPRSPSRFRHNAENPLAADVVVVDECSMVDFALMAKLVDAVKPSARLFLLGDRNQLASVEAGTVLADLCGPTGIGHLELSRDFASELRDVAGEPLDALSAFRPTRGPYDAMVQLTHSRRFDPASGIGRFARACLDEPFDVEAAAALFDPAHPSAGLTLLPHGRDGTLTDAARNAIVDGYHGYLGALADAQRATCALEEAHARLLRAFDTFRVLCAHRRGRLGVEALNLEVTRLLGGPRSRVGGEHWVGRPLLVTQNDYALGLFNGDIGIVVRDDRGKRCVVFREGGGVRYVAPARLPEHETAFAMTIHKSQGSEVAHVLLVLPSRASPILTRELIYTGVTRGKERVTLLCDGERDVLRQALVKSVKRASGLREALWGEDVGGPTVSRVP